MFGVSGKGFAAGSLNRYKHELLGIPPKLMLFFFFTSFHHISSLTDFEVHIYPPWKNVLLGPAPGDSDPIVLRLAPI